MKRRSFLQALLIVSISPSEIPKGSSLVIGPKRPKGDRVIKSRPFMNTGISDDGMLCSKEESLVFTRCLYAVDKNGNETFLKELSTKEYREISEIL